MPIIVTLSGEYGLDCDNAQIHGIPRMRDQYSLFNAKKAQWHYWTKLSSSGKTKISSEHITSGRCVLCIIDENIIKL